MAGFFRPEPPALAPVRAPAAVSSPRPVDRILVGGTGRDVEARIRFGAGALAGTELRLQCQPGGRGVEVEVLTALAGSRDTLSSAMNELRHRLRAKGIDVAAARRGSREAGPDPASDSGQRGGTRR